MEVDIMYSFFLIASRLGDATVIKFANKYSVNLSYVYVCLTCCLHPLLIALNLSKEKVCLNIISRCLLYSGTKMNRGP